MLYELRVNSQAPELYRGPRARCARSGENGEGGVRSLLKLDQKLSFKTIKIYSKFYKINSFFLIFVVKSPLYGPGRHERMIHYLFAFTTDF